jgi:glycosyltransferase involved in cell wall biosynthesis
VHKLLRYFGIEQSRMYQLERWMVLFDDLTINYRNSDEFYIKGATSLSHYVRDERRMSHDLARLASSGYDWKGRSIDCSYQHDPDAWDARYAVLKTFRDAFQLDFAELDVIQPSKNEFVVIDVNNTPGPSYKNVYFRELGVRLLTDRLGIRPAVHAPGRASEAASDVLRAENGAGASGVAPAPLRAPGTRTNICLCMIVKNETAVLPRLFRSLKDYVDYYVIVDTGSTDETIALIQREMGGYGVEGEVHERPWVNFGVNRQQALELAVAANRADWLLFIDADEELGVSDPKFYEKLEPGVSYEIEKHQGGLRYAVPHLVNVRASRFRWEGPVHNYLVTLEGPKPQALRKDVWIVYHHAQGAKSHNLTQEEKFLRDAKLLEEELARNPNDARSQFYLGQSYRDAGHLEKAIAAYKKRAAMDNGWDEERFMAQLEAGRVSIRLEAPEPVVLGELLAAYNLRPTRAEPLYELARYFRLRKGYAMATLFAKAGAQTPRPNDRLFVVENVYTWLLLDELSVAAYWIGDYVSAKQAGETLLARVAAGAAVPEGELRRIQENLAHALKKLGG